MKNLLVFEVQVQTTNAMRDTYCVGGNEGDVGLGHYFDCNDGTLYVVAENLAQVHALLGDIILGVRKLGYGRVAAHKEHP